jgi:thiamine biosynthesis lipoprotein
MLQTLVESSQNHMATTFEFQVSCKAIDSKRALRILEDAHKLVDEIENELTEYKELSPVFNLNHAPPHTPITLTRHLKAVLAISQNLFYKTNGDFDPTFKSVGQGNFMSRIIISPDQLSVCRTNDSVHLGFGAIGKGYAIDEIRMLLTREGFTDFLLSAGGSSISVSGFKDINSPWNIGWSWGLSQSGSLLGIPLSHSTGSPLCMGISGVHEKGQHILNPHPSKPNTNSMQSALVLHSSAAFADAASTGVFVSGWEKGIEQLNQNPSYCGLACIDSEGIPFWNQDFQKTFGALAGVFIFYFLNLSHAFGDDSVDLDALSGTQNSFNPYLSSPIEWAWLAAPVFILLLLFLHIQKNKKTQTTEGKTMKKQKWLIVLLLIVFIERANATQFEPLGAAIAGILGSKKGVQKKEINDATLYYLKSGAKVSAIAVVQKRVYKPNCTHTWVIGLNPVTAQVGEIKVVEMSCPHAFPTKEESYLSQYKGKGPADLATLDSKIDTIAKATGSCKLTTDAIKSSITLVQKNAATL